MIKVMNSNEMDKPTTGEGEGNEIENVFSSKIGQSNAYPEIS